MGSLMVIRVTSNMRNTHRGNRFRKTRLNPMRFKLNARRFT